MSTKSVEILFTTPKKYSAFSAFLRWYLKAPFSHVCLKIHSDFYERTMIYEASAGQVQAESFANWEKRNRIISAHKIEVDGERKKEVIQYCIDHLRHKYGILSLVDIFFRDKLGIETHFGSDGTKKFICSEFAYLTLQPEIHKIAKIKGLNIEESADYIDPNEIFALLS